MAHFPPRLGVALAVEMEVSLRVGQQFGPAVGGVANQVLHHDPLAGAGGGT